MTEAEKAPEAKAEPAPMDEGTKRKWELVFGIAVTTFAAMLAINELASGKYGDDEIQMNTEKTSAYLWYQSKGIKSNMTEGQRDLLKMLKESGVIAADKAASVDKQLVDLEAKVIRYEKQKTEILKGSSGVGKENWAQDVDGELGKVVGVKEIETKLNALGKAGDRFDLATLFLQLTLVVGAIGIITSSLAIKRAFLALMVTLGLCGVFFAIGALRLAGFF
jgi:hypothetical protein